MHFFDFYLILYLSWFILAQHSLQDAFKTPPRRLQDASQNLQDASKIPQDASKSLQDAAKTLPRDAKKFNFP